jgi:hypothetical protein
MAGSIDEHRPAAQPLAARIRYHQLTDLAQHRTPVAPSPRQHRRGAR